MRLAGAALASLVRGHPEVAEELVAKVQARTGDHQVPVLAWAARAFCRHIRELLGIQTGEQERGLGPAQGEMVLAAAVVGPEVVGAMVA